jgi:hypothetical protein
LAFDGSHLGPYFIFVTVSYKSFMRKEYLEKRKSKSIIFAFLVSIMVCKGKFSWLIFLIGSIVNLTIANTIEVSKLKKTQVSF